MKNIQSTAILIILLGLIGYHFYEKFEKKEPPINAELRYSMEAFNIDLPEYVEFCGEPAPLKEHEVRERFDREMHANVFWHSNTYLMLKRANRWFPRIEKILEANGIPADFKYLAVIESALTNVISPVGATGFWQFMKGTGKEFDLEINSEVDERYDPIKSTEAAAKYLKRAYKKFGSWTLVAASYNMGITGVERSLNRQKADSYYDLALNNETARYVFRILAIKEIFENTDKYHFKLKKQNLYYPEDLRYVEVQESIPDLVDFALKEGVSYKTLKFYNPWLRDKSLHIKNKKKSYQIAIPVNLPDASVPEETLLTTNKIDSLSPMKNMTDTLVNARTEAVEEEKSEAAL
ncbi:lytic transglycosylase domain-containing protein [Rapidithrix thailandica]|uniref:Lytic transglycosylase domain-containing protein n=1 Tax=Rapidithrix thailandica TaxID=413964 RepID=A0AAW9RTX5_9BACT